MKPHLTKKTGITIFGIILVILVTTLPSYYFYGQYKKTQRLLQNPSEIAKEETKKLITAVSKLIDLPTDEEPTIATVSDIEKLKNQPLFAKALNGDKVLFFANAQKAILYRPSADKIIEVASITIGPVSPATASGQTAQSQHIVLYNGTTVVGLTKKYETELKQKVPNSQVLDRKNAKRQDYEKTILVDLSGSKNELAQQLAQFLGIAVGQLPDGEITPKEADFLIILGSDKK